MSIKYDNYNNSDIHGYSSNTGLKDIELLNKCLEKYFYGTAKIRRCITDSDIILLIVEIETAIEFSVGITHFRNEILVNRKTNASAIKRTIEHLELINNVEIDIYELSVYAKDTSLIINQVSNKSIVYQLSNILRSLVSQYAPILNNLNEIPQEIYIPVLQYSTEYISLLGSPNNVTNETDFYKYWGLYFDDADKTIIYDLEKAQILYEDVLVV